jgi:starvation-inducible outer membrane lipoprotein
MRTIGILLAFSAVSAFAQTPPDSPREQLDPRKNQKVEIIVVEDDSNRIQEVRMGGQTEKVTVQPKDAPAYEIEPAHMARSRPADERNGMSSAGGKRRWNIFSF